MLPDLLVLLVHKGPLGRLELLVLLVLLDLLEQLVFQVPQVLRARLDQLELLGRQVLLVRQVHKV